MQHICNLTAVQSARELADHELLQRFVAGKDEAAFTVLVQRHGPMILGVCRRMLGSSHDAEDACQASFLVLAQKAASIRKTTSLSSWLHGVASRVAAKLKRERARRYKRENDSQPCAVPDPAAEVSWREVQTILDEELERLPDRLRDPLILCYLEGRTRDEAAARLGLSVACLHGRLERGRKALCDRLIRRGVTLSATLVATAIGEGVSGAALSPTVVVSTAKAAVLLGSARALDNGLISIKILSLAQEVSKNMLLTKMKLGLSGLCFAGLLVPALGGLLASLGAGPQAEEPRATGPSQAGAGKLIKSTPTAVPQTAQSQPNARPAVDERFSGRVLDADDKPVAGAKVYLLRPAYGLPPDKAPPKIWAETDKDGGFSYTAPRTEGVLFVTAPGFGPGWDTSFPRRAGEQETGRVLDNLVVRLARDDVPVSGRLLDLQGEPVAGATIRVFALKASPDGSLDKFIEAATKRPFGQLYNDQQHLVQFNVDGLAHFFPPVTTDKAGRFQIKGVGRERVVDFSAEAPTIETKVLHAVTRPGLGAAEIRIPEGIITFVGGMQKEDRIRLYYPPTFTHTADPCRVVTGVVRDKATGKPIAGAVVRGDKPVRFPPYYNRTTTDQEGRYRLAGLPLTPGAARPVVVVLLPPDGEPYLALRKTVPADKEAKEAKFDFDLPRGFWLEGQVKDKATGRGVPAQLQYFAPATRFAKDNWIAFLPYADKNIGMLLIEIAKPRPKVVRRPLWPSSGRRKRVCNSNLAVAT
ncbi:MAG TPA: sigma-70 family RNA polymerase sigma factor, partial [Pirellulales bacterium]|nr:sigma-70 family RNA polymerase sigma factor [Pirellulales bacterium]